VLLGHPVEATEKLPTLNTLGDIMLCDGRMYAIGQRNTLEVEYSAHVNFTTNQGAWRFLTRVDGQPLSSGAVTMQDSTAPSPFGGLAPG
jgi:HK97 family phage major capsid protein